jgi:pimeloyl-ACP methyl ester carboxylesterase
MIDRRQLLLGTLALTGAGLTRAWAAPAAATPLPQTGYAKTRTGERIYYEVTGPEDGPALFLAVPVYATTRLWTDAYLSYFTDKYRVLVADYPHNGRSDGIKNPSQFTAARVCDDYLSVATAAWGSSRKFALAGYSWGGNSSLVAATRTKRLSAVAVGGWPALGGPWRRLLEMSRDLNSKIYVTYYESLQRWTDIKQEGKDIKALRLPRLNYVDANDHGKFLGQSHATSASMIGPFRQHRETLNAWGWDTVEVDGGVAGEYGHTGGIRPDVACPVIRSFLDAHL